MRSKLNAIMILAAILIVSGCGRAPDKEQERHNQESRLTRLIDDRRYDDVIQLMEGNDEATRDFPDLLAMAYLGRSGFEPLRFASQVAAEQVKDLPDLSVLIPDCETRALQRFEQIPARCVIKRVFTHLPDPNDPDFVKARTLFRSTHPNPEKTPSDLNTLIATVETASALARVRKLVLQMDDALKHEIITEVSLALNDARQALNRARHASKMVSKLMTGLEAASLFTMDPSGRIEWLENTGIPSLKDYSSTPIPENQGTQESQNSKESKDSKEAKEAQAAAARAVGNAVSRIRAH